MGQHSDRPGTPYQLRKSQLAMILNHPLQMILLHLRFQRFFLWNCLTKVAHVAKFHDKNPHPSPACGRGLRLSVELLQVVDSVPAGYDLCQQSLFDGKMRKSPALSESTLLLFCLIFNSFITDVLSLFVNMLSHSFIPVRVMRKSNILDMNPADWNEIQAEEKVRDSNFQLLLDQCKVPPDLQDHLIQEGFLDSGTFAFAFSASEKFEDYLVDFAQTCTLEDSWLHSPPAASLRFLFHKASQDMNWNTVHKRHLA